MHEAPYTSPIFVVLWTLTGVGVLVAAFVAGLTWDLGRLPQPANPVLPPLAPAWAAAAPPVALPSALPSPAVAPPPSAPAPAAAKVAAAPRQLGSPPRSKLAARPAPPPAKQASRAPRQPVVPAAATRYTLQLSSFSNHHDAKEFAAHLTEQGFEPFLVSQALPNRGTWYRVRLGRFAKLQAAQQARQVLARADIPSWVTTDD